MSRFKISSEREEQLLVRMEELGVREEDFQENFIRGSGPGGQKINTSSSCVQLIHAKSGIEVRCQETRSQARNRYYARIELCKRLEERKREQKEARRQEAEREKRRKRSRPRGVKERILEGKRHQSKKKQQRKNVRRDDD